MISASAASSCSCDGPGSLSPLMGRTDFFYLCISSSVWGQLIPAWAGTATVPVVGVGAAAVLVSLFSLHFPLRALNGVE